MPPDQPLTRSGPNYAVQKSPTVRPPARAA